MTPLGQTGRVNIHTLAKTHSTPCPTTMSQAKRHRTHGGSEDTSLKRLKAMGWSPEPEVLEYDAYVAMTARDIHPLGFDDFAKWKLGKSPTYVPLDEASSGIQLPPIPSDLPPYAFKYVDCGAIGRSVPVTTHPSVASVSTADFIDPLLYLLATAKSADGVALVVTDVDDGRQVDRVRISLSKSKMVFMENSQRASLTEVGWESPYVAATANKDTVFFCEGALSDSKSPSTTHHLSDHVSRTLPARATGSSGALSQDQAASQPGNTEEYQGVRVTFSAFLDRVYEPTVCWHLSKVNAVGQVERPFAVTSVACLPPTLRALTVAGPFQSPFGRSAHRSPTPPPHSDARYDEISGVVHAGPPSGLQPPSA